MGDSSPSDTILGSPSDDQRCNKNDGKQWRCVSRKMQGKTLCERHFLKYCEYQTKKKNLPAQQQNNKPRKRKTPIPNNNKNKKKKKKKKKGEEIGSVSSEDDSIDKLFEDNFSKGEDDDSIEKLFDDDSIEKLFDENSASSSDVDSCPLVRQPRAKASTTSSRVKDEDVEEIKTNQETDANQVQPHEAKAL